MTANSANRGPVIVTHTARCQDCYRCVRVCPVKAIKVADGQASVVPERCIACGTCVRACPQGAKRVRDDMAVVESLLAGTSPVAVSIAPSFAAAFPAWQQRRLPSLLRGLGFIHVAETAVGAGPVAAATAAWVSERPGRRHICSACPAVVGHIARYRPASSEELVGLVSPMLAHAALIRERLGDDAKVVFIGPCFAKKMEADASEGRYHIDAAITFTELLDWLESTGHNLDGCEESDFDDVPATHSRCFALEGGCLLTAGLSADALAADTLLMSGSEALDTCLEESTSASVVVEALYCQHGCIGGPGMPEMETVFARRRAVLGYDRGLTTTTSSSILRPHDLTTAYLPQPVANPAVDEAALRRVLLSTGKHAPEDELNCGACGYDTCRDKAAAVIAGLAEAAMCMPWMRRLAEQRNDRIMETSPNGMVVVDRDLTVITLNPAFRRQFYCSDAAVGRPLSRLLDPDPFERAWSQAPEPVHEIYTQGRQGRIFRILLYAIEEEDRLVGSFTDITDERRDRDSLTRLRSETVAQAEEMLRHQVDMAQQLARLLGESTARGEALVEHLMMAAQGASDSPAPIDNHPATRRHDDHIAKPAQSNETDP